MSKPTLKSARPLTLLVLPEHQSKHTVFAHIALERSRQDEKWGPTPPRDYPDGDWGGGRKTWAAIARHSCDRAEREGRLTWGHILDEETAEALAETDPTKLRDELVQVAAVAVAWIQALDARASRAADNEEPACPKVA